MPTFGHLKRNFPRFEPLRGWDPNEPFTQTAAYRVKDGETILSGMIISPVWNADDALYEWAVGIGAVADRRPIYIAQNDSTDEDVIEAGTLNAFSCAGQFELQIAFYDPEDTYNEGTALTACLDATDEGIAADVLAALGRTSGAGDGKGFVKAAATDGTVPIIGYVTRAAGSAVAGSVNSVDGINSNVVFKDVISFRTSYSPAVD